MRYTVYANYTTWYPWPYKYNLSLMVQYFPRHRASTETHYPFTHGRPSFCFSPPLLLQLVFNIRNLANCFFYLSFRALAAWRRSVVTRSDSQREAESKARDKNMGSLGSFPQWDS